MKRREYLTGVAGVGALTAVGATGQVAAASNHTLGTITDPSGDDNGPGSYVYPTASEFKGGVYDMQEVTVTDDGDAWTFTTSLGGPVENPYGFDGGFSVQVFQLYVQDPNAADDAPASTEGRIGTNVTFAEPYHYRVHVVGNGQAVEDASSPDPSEANVVQDGLSVSASPSDGTITFSVPKDAIGGGDLADKKVAMLLLGQDGFGTGGVRNNFAEEAAEYAVGGAAGDNSPHVFDMLDPDGVVDQSEALSYSSDSKASIPLFEMGEVIDSGSSGGTDDGSDDSGSDDGGLSYPVFANDPAGDDNGPGSYVYPTAGEFKNGVFDIAEVALDDAGDSLSFTTTIGGPVENPYGFDGGFSVQVFQAYIHDPNAADDAPASTAGREGSNVTFEDPYHYRVHVVGNNQVVEDAEGTTLAEISASGNSSDGTISFSVPKDAIGGADNFGDYRMSFLLFGQDGFGTGAIRQNFASEAAEYAVGGVDSPENAPRAFDLLSPEGVVDQGSALSYSADSKASVPLTPVSDLFGGEQGPPDADRDGVPDSNDYAPENAAVQDPPSEALPGADGPPQNTDGDPGGYVEDIDGDGDTDADDVRLLLNERKSDAVQNNSGYFDSDGDGRVTVSDVADLYRRIFR